VQGNPIVPEPQLFATIAAPLAVHADDATAGDARLARLVRQHPRYRTSPGLCCARGLALTPLVGATRRAWFKRILKDHAYAAGRYRVGTITEKAVINLG
jgi:hypothetical protein